LVASLTFGYWVVLGIKGSYAKYNFFGIDNPKFTSKLWNVDCEQALRLINKEQRIDFQYENAGRKGPILVYLKIESIVIVDNK